MWDFFEQPWTLLGAAVLVLLGVLTFRSVWYEKRRPWQWMLPAGVALLGVGLDLAVTTDLEKINQLTKAGVQAVEAEDLNAIGRLLAADYQDSYHKSREALLTRCRAHLTPASVQKVRRVSKEVELTPPEAKVTLVMWLTFDKDSYWAQAYKPTALVAVQFYLRKQPDRSWLIRRAEVIEVDKTPVTWGVAQAPPPETGGNHKFQAPNPKQIPMTKTSNSKPSPRAAAAFRSLEFGT